METFAILLGVQPLKSFLFGGLYVIKGLGKMLSLQRPKGLNKVFFPYLLVVGIGR